MRAFFRERTAKLRHPRHEIFEPRLIASDGTVVAPTYCDFDFVEPSADVRIPAGRYNDVLIRVRERRYF